MISAANRHKEHAKSKLVIPSRKSIALTDEAIIRREMKIYEDKKEECIEKYEGKYIALLNGELLDSDVAISELSKRVYEKYGYIAILMQLVCRRSKPYRISSPKFNRVKTV
jgi:hypothetical protein